jgi:hypothetical protein
MNNIDKVLQDCLGQNGAQSLKKSIIRLKTNSMADPSELYLPLLVVPRTIMSWLVQNILPLKIGEYKDFKFPGQEDTVISVEKLDSDVYRGEFVRDAHVIHRFNHQTLPSISGHLLTVFELYDQLDVQAPKENQSGSMEMLAQIMAMNNIMPKQQTADPVALKSLDMLGKLIDVLVADKINKDKTPAEDIKEIVEDKKDEPKEEEKQEVSPMKKEELLMKPKKSYFKKKLEDISIHKAFEGASGAAMPKAPKMPVPPTAPGSKPQGMANQQADMSAKGKVAMPKAITPTAQPKTASAPKMPSGPKAPKMAQQTFKSENYFKKKLDKSQMAKSEKSYYCNEAQIFRKCKLCLKPEFAKTESAPKYSPCSCFKVTKNDFVSLKKSGEGFLLSFAPAIDQDTIDSFLNILRD